MFGRPFGYGVPANFAIHLSTSELVTQLVVDSESLSKEFHEPGYYDENGDYFPQYCDDPEKMPKVLSANAPAPSAERGPESDTPPADTPPADTPPNEPDK